jgi:predicted metal-dependent hydrolase
LKGFRESLRGGAHLFHRGAFFEAHEEWEQRWRGETDPTRRKLLQGLIQIAAALHKLLVQRSPEAAFRLFTRGLAKLDDCPANVAGVDVGSFREGARACANALAEGRFLPAEIPELVTLPRAGGGGAATRRRSLRPPR